MNKFLKKAGSVLSAMWTAFSNQYFQLLGLVWIFCSFIYIGKPQFWVVLGFGVLFTGIQQIINEIKLTQN